MRQTPRISCTYHLVPNRLFSVRFGFLARLRGERLQFGEAMFEPCAVARRFGNGGAGGDEFFLRGAPRRMCSRHRAGVGARIGVEQGAMPGGREQAAVVVLAVDFDQMAADFAQQRRRTGLVVEEGAAAAIALQRTEERVTGREGGSTCISRWWPYNIK